MAALQEAGLWRYAATLTAHTLKGDERAAALERWAAHVHQVPSAPTAPPCGMHICAQSRVAGWTFWQQEASLWYHDRHGQASQQCTAVPMPPRKG